MKLARAISVLKIFTVISFLFVEIPNEKFIVPVIIAIYIGMLGLAGIYGIALYSFILIAIAYFLFSLSKKDKLNDFLSLFAIATFYILIGLTIKNVIAQNVFISWLTYSIFLLLSIATIGFLVHRLQENDYK